MRHLKMSTRPATNLSILGGLIAAAAGLLVFSLALFQVGLADKGILLDFLGRFSSTGFIRSPEKIFAQLFCGLVFIMATGLKIFGDNRPFFSPSKLVRAACLMAIFMVFSWFMPDRWNRSLHGEDRFMENLTVVLLLGAGAMLVWPRGGRSAWLRWATRLMAGVLFVVAMEEISWGQRLFGWSTPAEWVALNDQGETNFHNLFTPYFPILYFVVLGFGAWLVLSARQLATLLSDGPRVQQWLPLIPDERMYQLGPLLATVAVYALLGDGREVAEEVSAVTAFVYAYFVRRNLNMIP